MARKDVFASVLGGSPSPAAAATRPMVARFTSRGAAGAVTRSIDHLAARASAAEELEAQLKAGRAVIELDPSLVDPSFVADRMNQDDEAYRSLRSVIEAQGQNTPILVRPHPTKEGRYQVAFGHRRLRVALDIGRPVRAVVKEMNDQELILAQGQENSARADLSFIERARFARSLEKLGYSRDVITAALAADKTALSRMIAVVTKIPAAAIEMIGPAHGVGRPRWLELANLFEGKDAPADLPVLRESEEFRRADSDARFDLVASFLVSGGKSGRTEGRQGQGTHAGRPRFDAQHWGPADGDRLVTMTHNARSSVIAVDRRHAPGFGEFILAQMDRLYVEYVATRPDEAPEK